MDFVTQFNFGEVPIEPGAASYKALAQRLLNEVGTVSEEERPNYVQVSERRGENNGWELMDSCPVKDFVVRQGNSYKGQEFC